MTITCAGSLRCLLIFAATALAAQTNLDKVLALPGEAPLSASQAERSNMNLLTMGLRVASDCDDNALNGQQDPQGDVVAFIQPHLGWRFSRARLGWAVDYTPGVSRSQSFPAFDALSHLLDSGFQMRLTKRLSIAVHEAFLKSANPFDQLQAFESARGSAVSTMPLDAAPVTPADVRTEQASVDIVHAVTEHSTAGIGGEFFSARYSLPSSIQSPSQLLQNSNSVAGHGYYMRQVTRHQWTGLDYHVQKSIFNSGQSWSIVHSFAYTHTIALSPPMTFSFFAGPERSFTQNGAGFSSSSVPAGHQSAWHWSGGVTGRWNGKRTSVSGRLSRRVNVGGILGAALVSSSSAEASRQFARQWTARLLASYDDSKALVGPGALSYASVAGGLTHTLSTNLSFEFQYWRVRMSSNGSLPASLLADHNRISLSLMYEHRQPLGR